MLKAILIGNVCRDPQTRSAGKNTVCSLSVASNNKRGGKDETTFVDVSAWGKTGEICQQYLKKGSKVWLLGDLSMKSYQAKDGTTRYTLNMDVDNMELLSPPSGAPSMSKPTQTTPVRKAPQPEDEEDEPPF